MPEAETESIFQGFAHDGLWLVYGRWWLTRTSGERESNSGTLSKRSGPLTTLSPMDSGVGMGARRPVGGCQVGFERVWLVRFPDPVGGRGYGMEPLVQRSYQEPSPEPWSPAGAGTWTGNQGLGPNLTRADYGPSGEPFNALSAMPSSGPPESGF